MRQYGYILAIVVLLIPPILTRWMHGSTPIDIPDASIPRLVIITPHNQDIRNEFRWAFADWHQKKYGKRVELEFLAVGGTNDIKRQLDTTYREIRNRNGGSLPPEDQVDVGIQLVWGGGDYFFDQLKGLGILRPITLDPAIMTAAFPQSTLGGLKLYDQDKDKSGKLLPPKWIGVCLSSFGIVYNPDLYHAMGLQPPVTWADLTDPRLAGSLALADPSHSSSAAVAYMMVIQRAMADAESQFFNLPENKDIAHDKLVKSPGYSAALDAGWLVGMRRLLLIAANARYFSDSATQVPTDVAGGDAAAGVAIDFYGHVVSQIVGPEREKYVSPPAATAINPDPIAILYGTQGHKLELAQHFVEFLLSPQGQRLWILKVGQPDGPRQRELHRPPIRQDVYTDRSGWADDANYFAEAGGFNQRGAWGANLTDVRMIWSATWIDDRDDLRDAYEKILAVSDPQRRQKLLDDLLDIPISRGEVDDMMAHRRKVEADPAADADEWHAEQRAEIAKRFRDHYRKVAAEASQ